MRNAATLDDDYGYDAPTPRKAAKKPRAGASGKKKRKGKRFSWDHVARYGAIGISMTVAVGIMVNALMMQKGHHPAPLFGNSLVPHGGPAPVAAAPAAAPAPAQASHAASNAVAPDDSGANTARRAAAPSDALAPADDPIARLLNGGKATASAIDKPDGKTVMGIQKALIKLGFSLKANGTMGASTRKAIEAFEKDRHLPVNGEVNRRLVKVLTAESGLHIE